MHCATGAVFAKKKQVLEGVLMIWEDMKDVECYRPMELVAVIKVFSLYTDQ